jgi:hypothetical protein
MQLSSRWRFRRAAVRVTLRTHTSTDDTPMFAFLRSRLARSFSARTRDTCIASADIGEGAFEHLHTAPTADLGRELREWLHVAWVDGDGGLPASRCRG